MGGAGGARAGEAKATRKSAGCGWAHGVLQWRRGSGQLADTCALLGCGRREEPQGSPHLLSFSKWEHWGKEYLQRGLSTPRSNGVPIPRKGVVPAPQPHQQGEGLLTPGPGGVGVPASPQLTPPPLPCVSLGVSDRRNPKAAGTKVGVGGAGLAPLARALQEV